MNFILCLIVIILDIMALADVLQSKKDSTEKLVWVIVILLMPLIGMVLYYVIGKKQS